MRTMLDAHHLDGGASGGRFVSGAFFVGRSRTVDNMMTFDSQSGYRTFDAAGDMVGKHFAQSYTTHDGRTCDSTGAYLVGELERLDPTIHEPLASVSWSRDVDLREDVTIADEVSSFTQSTYGSQGGLGTGNSIGNGKAWIGKNTDQISGVSVDIAKIPHPLRPWALEIKYTILELESSLRLGRPIDQQKYNGLKLKHQMDVDEQVYIGDLTTGDTGLVNSSSVTNVSNFANGAQGTSLWANKTPVEILADVNTALTSVWAASAWAKVPNRIILPPSQFGLISTGMISQAGNTSILKYIRENNLLATTGAGALEIVPGKWNIGAGVGGTLGTISVDRMVVYTKDKDMVRFPMTLLQRTPVQYDSIYHKTTYFCRLGVLEVVYPETIAYFDGL